MQLPEDIVWKMILSLILGGIIGAEREYRSKSAGFRTLTLICLGATLFTAFSLSIGGKDNPDRIASNIVTGIGFVGAGVIFKSDFGVSGITTAAMIWATAAMGMGIGAGYRTGGHHCLAVILAMLLVYGKLEGWIDRANQTRNYKIVCDYQNETLKSYEMLLKKYKLQFYRGREIKRAALLQENGWPKELKKTIFNLSMKY